MSRRVPPWLAASVILALLPSLSHAQRAERQRSAAIAVPAPQPEAPRPNPNLVSTVTLADIGFVTGLRFSNLGGRRELFIPLPQGADLAATELVLSLDDVSSH